MRSSNRGVGSELSSRITEHHWTGNLGRGRFRTLVGVLAVTISLCPGCRTQEPVKIGFIGGLSGRVADLGIGGRDGAILAVEVENREGGVHGRSLELFVVDDRQDPRNAVAAVGTLVDAGVVAIVGPMTSAMAVACVPMANENEIVMVSPTTSTNQLSSQDDYFFRVYPASAQTSRLLAERVANDLQLARVYVVYDVTNQAHTVSAFEAFRGEFESLGGAIIGDAPFYSGPDVHFMPLARAVVATEADCLYVLANAMDAAMLCQQIRKLDHEIKVISSDWSATDEIINFGGSAVDGMYFLHTLDCGDDSPAYREFARLFLDRFGRKPDFAACHAYDATRIIAAALRESNGSASLKDTILRTATFSGLQSDIQFDQYGDVIRSHHPVTIRDGLFVVGL